MRSYAKLYKRLLKDLGAEAAVLYALIEETYIFAKKNNALVDGWCFLTVNKVKELSGIGKRGQERSIKKLIDYGVIYYKVRGMPARRWFMLTNNCGEKELQESSFCTNQLVQNELTSKCNLSELDSANRASNKPRYINLDINTRTKSKSSFLNLYQSTYGLIGNVLFEDMKESVNKYTEDWCYEALKISIKNGKGKDKVWNYTKGILANWFRDYEVNVKPWELKYEKHTKQCKYKNGVATAKDWENEPDELIIG